MEMLRNLVAGNRTLASIVLLATLVMKAVIPAGYMVEIAPRTIFVSVCSDASDGHELKQIAVPIKDAAPERHDASKKDCPFSTLGTAAVPGTDAGLLAVALVFLLALGFVPVATVRLVGLHHLRPPLRGPPAAA